MGGPKSCFSSLHLPRNSAAVSPRRKRKSLPLNPKTTMTYLHPRQQAGEKRTRVTKGARGGGGVQEGLRPGTAQNRDLGVAASGTFR